MILVGVANMALRYWSDPFLGHLLFNADALYLPTLVSDLLSAGGRLDDWYLTPSPYFFPDFALYLMAHLLAPGPFDRILLFSILQFVCLFWAVDFLMRRLRAGNAPLTAACIAVTLLWMALNNQEPFKFLLTSAHHYGAFVSGILLIGLWLGEDESRGFCKGRTLPLSILLVFAASLSDSLFIIEGVAPLVGAVLMAQISARRISPASLVYPGLMLLSVVLGLLSYRVLLHHDTHYPYLINLRVLHRNLVDVFSFFSHSVKSNPPLWGLLPIYFAICGFATYRWLWRKSLEPTLLVALFSLISLLASVLVICAQEFTPPTGRYLIPAFSWMVIVAVMAWSAYARRCSNLLLTVISLSFLLSLSINSYQAIQSHGLAFSYYPDHLKCMDEFLQPYGEMRGVAPYWDAKPAQNFSRLKPTIAQYTDQGGRLEEYRWITSSRYFGSPYDFAIISEKYGPPHRVSGETVIRSGGSPDLKIDCGDQSIYLYKAQGLRISSSLKIGENLSWKACDLPTVVGVRDDQCHRRKGDQHPEAGFVTQGPDVPLPLGEYHFEIAVSSPQEKEEVIGDWDVLNRVSDRATQLSKGPILGTGNQPGIIQGTFRIHEKSPENKVEVRTWARENASLEVSFIRLTRVR